MAKKDCMNCRNCILRPMAYQAGVTNTCRFEDRIQTMPQDELVRRMITKECDWFEQGTPEKSSEVCYDD